ncbi:MAG: Coenzyme F420 hydrogenase/dehydrogenase, beta subunit C-terminal domain [Paludibacteraceae bacterium]|nr:Coenzyme F420 hydrogenase/dehydrogenase, beta subunit C-terminal domain [Paludibacteraceae bacterium]
MNHEVSLCPPSDCTGCFACEAICSQSAISQFIDKEGFRYPRINYEKCIGCGACERTCPVINPIKKYQTGKIYAAWSLDDRIREKSSSGGVFSELALATLRKGGVVVGASMDVNSGYIYHSIVTSEEDLDSLRGSKYVQSNISGSLYRSISIILKEGRVVLFSGCPCQVAGIRSYFKDCENLFCIDLACHGVPSPELFKMMFDELKSAVPHLEKYNFRQLKMWGSCTSPNIVVSNLRQPVLLTGKYTFYQDAYIKGYSLRSNCYSCQYSSVNRIGDISLADFWGIGKMRPIDASYKKGCSLVSLNNERGAYLYNEIKQALFCEEREIEETIEGGNTHFQRSCDRPSERDSFYCDVKSLSIDELIIKYNLSLISKPTIFNKIINKVYNLLRVFFRRK